MGVQLILCEGVDGNGACTTVAKGGSTHFETECALFRSLWADDEGDDEDVVVRLRLRIQFCSQVAGVPGWGYSSVSSQRGSAVCLDRCV